MLEFFKTWETQRPHWGLIIVKGSDAADFLNRLTTVGTLKLPEGSTSVPGFLLNAKAQIQSSFQIHRPNKEEFWLELDPGHDGWAVDQTLKALDDMHFGEEIQFQQQDDESMKCLWALGESIPDFEGKVVHGTLFGKKWNRIWGDPAKLETLVRNGQIFSSGQFDHQRINHLVPWTDFEIRSGGEKYTPLELGQYHGVDRNKGCYPGQEVIEKIYTYGAPPKRLVKFKVDAPCASGMKVMDADREVGVITSMGSGVGLAVVKKTHAQERKTLHLENGNNIEILKVSDYGKEAA